MLEDDYIMWSWMLGLGEMLRQIDKVFGLNLHAPFAEALCPETLAYPVWCVGAWTHGLLRWHLHGWGSNSTYLDRARLRIGAN